MDGQHNNSHAHYSTLKEATTKRHNSPSDCNTWQPFMLTLTAAISITNNYIWTKNKCTNDS